jgi:hypothetical protein
MIGIVATGAPEQSVQMQKPAESRLAQSKLFQKMKYQLVSHVQTQPVL